MANGEELEEIVIAGAKAEISMAFMLRILIEMDGIYTGSISILTMWPAPNIYATF